MATFPSMPMLDEPIDSFTMSSMEAEEFPRLSMIDGPNNVFSIQSMEAHLRRLKGMKPQSEELSLEIRRQEELLASARKAGIK